MQQKLNDVTLHDPACRLKDVKYSRELCLGGRWLLLLDSLLPVVQLQQSDDVPRRDFAEDLRRSELGQSR